MKRIWLVAAACLATVDIQAQSTVIAGAIPLGGQDKAAQVDSIFARFSGHGTPGCAVAVMQSGAVTFSRGYGLADLENDVPITPATAFYLASESKQFAAYSIILLARDGVLSLDDDVRKFVPELHDFGARERKPITIRHLLNHTSGLRDYFAILSLSGWPGDGPVTERDFLDIVGRQRTLNFSPGRRFLYSNTGYVLLSIIVKRASGKTLREFAKARIFDPLGMASSTVRDDHTMLIKRRASAYVAKTGGGWLTSVPGFDVVGDGGIFSTVEDLARWVGNFYDPRVGDQQTLSLLHQRGVLNSGDTIDYAAGVGHGRYRGLRTVEHGGGYGGYRTMLRRFPDQRFATAVLCNNGTANPGRLSQRVAEVYLGAEMEPVGAGGGAAAAVSTAPLSGADIARYSGIYWDEESEARLVIAGAAGKLTVAGLGTPIELRHLGAGRFDAPSVAIKVAFADGRVDVTAGDARPVRYAAVASERPPAPDELSALAGNYVSEEADAQFEVRVRDGRLEISGRRISPIPLEHIFGRTFAGGSIIVRFVGKGGVARRLTLSSGRSRGVSFERR